MHKRIAYTLMSISLLSIGFAHADKSMTDQDGREFHPGLKSHIAKAGVPQEWPGKGGHTLHHGPHGH
jgi:hypothetical protein